MDDGKSFWKDGHGSWLWLPLLIVAMILWGTLTGNASSQGVEDTGNYEPVCTVRGEHGC